MKTHRRWRDQARVSAQRMLQRAAERVVASEYTLTLPSALRVHTPWYTPSFVATHQRVATHTTLSVERLYYLQMWVAHAASLDGALAEVGSYRGGSGRIIAEGAPAREVHLFDTFSGMPNDVQHARDGHVPGDFGDTSVSSVAAYLADLPHITLHPGYVPETFDAVLHERFSFCHCDLDTYHGTLVALAFFYDRMVPGGVFLFDEYGLRAYRDAERAAADEFFADKQESPIVLGSGQAFVIKRA